MKNIQIILFLFFEEVVKRINHIFLIKSLGCEIIRFYSMYTQEENV
jgi:hypothetical protein